jgi:hypothetical protein
MRCSIPSILPFSIKIYSAALKLFYSGIMVSTQYKFVIEEFPLL